MPGDTVKITGSLTVDGMAGSDWPPPEPFLKSKRAFTYMIQQLPHSTHGTALREESQSWKVEGKGRREGRSEAGPG